MELKVLFCTLLCIFTAFSSCKKSDDEQHLNLSVPKIKTITHHGSQTVSENYEYDASGRVLNITYSGGTYDQYDYRMDKIIRKTFVDENFPPIPIRFSSIRRDW
ncbi:MAG TPA: hypothetical protein DCL77_04280 [Prolixibacteraceae bacterium]|jgi:hypothetical protein|nr:hypothetical protein [Prolixibacteraceae bacterium]